MAGRAVAATLSAEETTTPALPEKSSNCYQDSWPSNSESVVLSYGTSFKASAVASTSRATQSSVDAQAA